MSDTEQVNEKYNAFLEEAKGLKATLEALKKYNSIEDLSEKLPLTDFAQLNASLAYCLNSLYYSTYNFLPSNPKVYMKANGISFEEHKINQEIERVKQYFTKIQEVILAEESEKKNPLTVNKEAAERMIRAHLQDQFIKDENSILLNDDDDLENNQDAELGQENEAPNQDEIDVEETSGKKPKRKQKLHKGSLLPSGAHLTWKEELDKMLK